MSPPTNATEFAATEAVLQQALADYKAALEVDKVPPPHLNDFKPAVLDDPNFVPSPALGQATMTLISSLGRMTHMVQTSVERYRLLSLEHWINRSVVLVDKQKIAQLLVNAGDKGMSVEELGPKVNVHPERLLATLRLLANEDIFVEVKEGVFAHNRTSMALAQVELCSATVGHLAFHSYLAAVEMPRKWADSTKQGKIEPDVTLWSEQFGYTGKMNYWQYLESAGLTQRFATMMGCIPTGSLAQAFDFSGLLGNGTTIVDIGGGRGTTLMAILDRYPTLKGIVLDMAPVRQAFDDYWRDSTVVKEGRISFEVGNYFDEQPEKRRNEQGYHYLVRCILHDLPDDKAVTVLRRIAAAMHSSSKLIVIDEIMQPALPQPIGTKPLPLETPPGPLPASGGMAKTFRNLLDLEMHASFNAKERTKKDFEALYAQAGLKLVKTAHFTASYPLQVVELAP